MLKSEMQYEYNKDYLLFKDSTLSFYNHGYSPAYNFLNEELNNQASLYCKIIENITTENKRLLDVSCGRGGGLYIYNKHYNFKELSGCDVLKEPIDYCKKKYKNTINFTVQDATSLSYSNKSFDIVVSVEASHAYSLMSSFVSESHRVLDDSGTLIVADVFSSLEQLNYLKNIMKYYFNNVEIINITKNVTDSCLESIDGIKKNIKDKKINKFLIDVSERFYPLYRDNFLNYFILISKKEVN